MFVWPMPAGFREIYSEDYFSGATAGFGYADYDNDKLPMIPTFEDYLDRMEAAAGSKGRLLDIGAATGFFLGLARDRGWQVCGVEASPHATKIANAKGLDVRAGLLEECDFAEASFDAVTMWDVIEHMPAPGPVLETVARLMKPGALLAINTPDSGSALARVAGTKWHLVIPPEHLNLFSRKSLGLALGKFRYEILQFTTIGKRFTLQYVFQTLSHVIKPGFTQIASRLRGTRLGLFDLSINLRDNMFVLARKPRQ